MRGAQLAQLQDQNQLLPVGNKMLSTLVTQEAFKPRVPLGAHRMCLALSERQVPGVSIVNGDVDEASLQKHPGRVFGRSHVVRNALQSEVLEHCRRIASTA